MLCSTVPHKKPQWNQWVRNPSSSPRRTKARRMELPNHTGWFLPRFFPKLRKSPPSQRNFSVVVLSGCCWNTAWDITHTISIWKMHSSEVSIVFLGKMAVWKKKMKSTYILVTAWTNLDKNTNFWKAKSKEEIKICEKKTQWMLPFLQAFKKGNRSLIETLRN